MPIWFIIVILILLIIIYCFANKYVIKASEAPKEYEVNNRGEITYLSNHQDSYV